MVFLLFALSLAAGLPTKAERAQMAADGIRAYVAPAIDESNSFLNGKIRVEVLVAEDGSVTEVRPSSRDGDPALSSLAQTAVRQWKFAPSRTRWRTVTFVIEPSGATTDDSRLETRYESPRTLRVTWLHSMVLRWGVHGRPPEKSCDVHHETMHTEILPVVNLGIPTGHPDALLYAEWERAFLTEFPNGSDFIGDGDDHQILAKVAEAYVCASCRKVYKAWLAAHHLEQPPR